MSTEKINIIFRDYTENVLFPFSPKNEGPVFVKKNPIFPNNTGNIISYCNFYKITISSQHLKKENMIVVQWEYLEYLLRFYHNIWRHVL